MLYREAGQFKTTYSADMAVFPIRQDRIGIAVILLIAYVGVPLFATLILTLAAIGLNILTGYTGLISLGTGAFMGVGAFACFQLTTRYPDVNVLIWILTSGFFAAAIGAAFGIPSLRIKGLYLAVATLAAQFFLEWCFRSIPWLTNNSSSGSIEAATRTILGVQITGPGASDLARYLSVLTVLVLLTWITSNIVHGRIGRKWMMVRDMDIAAELMGIRLLPTKLLAFAVSSYLCGVSGAMLLYFHYGSMESTAFSIELSFQILFMVIIGGLGSLIGSYFGAAFIAALPIFLKFAPQLVGLQLHSAHVDQATTMLIGMLIVFFLIVEPHGLARLWQIGKQKLRVWPFPY
jgi:branched-chain amino acid transport system permease protein